MVRRHLSMYSPCQASPCQPYWGQPWRCLAVQQSSTPQSSRLQRFRAWSLNDKSGIAATNDLVLEPIYFFTVCEFCSSHERDVDAVAGRHRHEGHQPANQWWKIFHLSTGMRVFWTSKKGRVLVLQHRCVETKGCSQGSSSGGYIGGAQGGDRDGHIAWPAIKLAGFQKQDPVPTCLCNWQVRWSSGWTIARRQQQEWIDRRSSCSRWSAC